ncbi:MAG: hypothetical protein JXQ75_11665 [Phycisphaerae bacterium]|nr:hypothetical protein [Phycisphaerae bacterium]
MTKHSQAVQVLLTMRRRLLDRLADAVTKNADALLHQSTDSHHRLACHHEIEEMATCLGSLDAGIMGLRDVSEGGNGPASRPGGTGETGHTHRNDRTFARFVQLVKDDRPEEAAQELVRILRMPLSRLTTATRFFSRALRADPTLALSLSQLPERIENASSAQCMSLLVKTFGFQAVESRMAVQALRMPSPPSGGAAAPASGVAPALGPSHSPPR